ncbi:response regulator transcription factor [Cerasicoccus arenae]|uniref:response regulator transcription factor n=1 Tax=Cerasicoccus arenae TaxID=424488 RepID=UPI00167B3854|nr:response regulator transcription factor [Cerasicoccus arenae]MBK1857003.1 response regulator transcription factor [Cerasicoccus arenae]
MKILAVEDERKIAEFIRKGLEAEGHVVDTAKTGKQGLLWAREQSYDAVVLDIMLPEQDGLDVLRCLRREGLNMPVVLVTARGQLDDRVEGLRLGADDYLVKPFYMEELAARLLAVSRRTTGEHLNLRQYGDLTLNLATREVRWSENLIELTAREFNMLEFFMRSPGRVYTRPQILEHVWQYHFDPGTNLVDVYIKRLRRKLMDEGAPPCIETVRGVGYRLAA